MQKALAAEGFGTFWLVFGGCGSAIFAAAFPEVGIGLLGVSLAFGLTVLTMAYTVGHISGGHFNPAVSLGLFMAGRFEGAKLLPYIGAQLLGGVVAALVLYLILAGKADFTGVGGFAANGYGQLSPGGFGVGSAFIMEVVMTFFFLVIIIGATSPKAPAGFAPIAIGLGLTLIHLVSIPVTNTSVNPARSTSQALFAGGGYIAQLWLFWLAPMAGAVLAGIASKWLQSPEDKITAAPLAPPTAPAA
jgi:aquaporin Z